MVSNSDTSNPVKDLNPNAIFDSLA